MISSNLIFSNNNNAFDIKKFIHLSNFFPYKTDMENMQKIQKNRRKFGEKLIKIAKRVQKIVHTQRKN